jgi:hypothetical protein
VTLFDGVTVGTKAEGYTHQVRPIRQPLSLEAPPYPLSSRELVPQQIRGRDLRCASTPNKGPTSSQVLLAAGESRPQGTPGAQSFALFAKGGIRDCSTQDLVPPPRERSLAIADMPDGPLLGVFGIFFTGSLPMFVVPGFTIGQREQG